jgi:hypothetical protein
VRSEIFFSPDSNGLLSRVAIAPAKGAKQVFGVEVDAVPLGQLLLRAVDLNFDGVLDLSLTGVAGTPNAPTELFVINAEKSSYFGQFTSPRVDPALRQVVSYEKGGHAGFLFRERTFKWRKGQLELQLDVEQTVENGSYFRTTREFVEGNLSRTTRREVKPSSEGK